MNQIFISYSSSDKTWAQALEDRLVTAGLQVFRDKTRLTAGRPYEKDLFNALADSSILLILWSSRVRDMKGEWKEWVITERERFRACHQNGPIIGVLLDDEKPEVGRHTHMIDLLRGAEGPGKVRDSTWQEIVSQVKTTAYSKMIEINYYTLAATRSEFEQLRSEPNLQQVLQNLNLKFDQVVGRYGVNRTDWKPAGGPTIKEILSVLEGSLARVLKEEGVPERFRGCEQLITHDATPNENQDSDEPQGLWSTNLNKVKEEINRLARLDFCWIIIDPLSLYHPIVYMVANRIGNCADRNQWLNIFLIDPIGRILEQSNLRTKLQIDFSVYQRLVKPRLLDSSSCLGGVDVWHADDFERVFRETIRLHRQANTKLEQESAPERALASLTHK